MDLEDIPEPDRLDGAPHPRMTPQVFGQEQAERAFLAAHASGRMHHAWMITGPRGIGKATLAWRMARFLLTAPDPQADEGLFGAPAPPDTLDVDPDHPVARRIKARSESALFLLRRPWDEKTKKLKTQITADPTRKLREFFSLSAGGTGRRVVIVDSADEMNSQAANAVLKVLEEPPARAVLLLIAHQPAALLPTIRSRCRVLPCQPLAPEPLGQALDQAGIDRATVDQQALTVLSGGSVGAAVQVLSENGATLYAELIRMLGTAPRLNRAEAKAWADRAGPWGRPATLDQSMSLIETALARLARTGLQGPPAEAAAPNEQDILTRLAPDPASARVWATLHRDLSARNRRAAALNLDPAALLLDTLIKMNQAAESCGTAPA